jgi:triosephosphate isomerase
MNHLSSDVKAFFDDLNARELPGTPWIAPQSIHLSNALANKGTAKIGAQNCHFENSGAFTGEISPKALVDLGADFTLVGHSERRALFHESGDFLNQKVLSALNTGLIVVYCVGETLQERESGTTDSVIELQLDEGLKDLKDASKLIIAYEPVWAIGTGKTATPDQAQNTHAFIRKYLKNKGWDTPILYGGSVKPSNTSELMACPDIDGALVGGASLSSEDFYQILEKAHNLN